MRLVDADKLIEDIENSWDWISVNGINASTAIRQTITDIQNAPTVDVVTREQLDKVKAEIVARKHDLAIYEYAGAYTDGKLAAHEYDLELINKYCGEGEK